MGLDFYGVDIAARIIVPQKTEGKIGGRTTFKEYRLWLGDDDNSFLVPNALKDLAYVQDVTVQIGLGLNSKVSLTLTPPDDDALELIHSPLVNWAASELKVQIGYSTGDERQRKTMEFGGLMMKPDVRMGPNPSITLHALGVAYGLNLSNATSERTYVGYTPWRAVKDTLQKYLLVDLGPDSEVFPDFSADQMNENSPTAHPFFKPVIGKKASTAAEHADAEKKKAAVRANVAAKRITKAEGEAQIANIDSNIRREDERLPINKGPRNDWWFVRETVKGYGLEIVIRDTSVEIRDPEKWKMGRPKYMFVRKGEIDTTAQVPIYPILDFNSPSSFVWLAPGSGGALIADVSADTKEEVQKQLSTLKNPKRDPDAPQDEEVLGRFTSAGVLKNAVKKVSESVAVTRTGKGAYNSAGGPDAYQVFPGSPEDARADQVVSELRNYNNNRGIQCEVTTIGIPAILPADVVQLDGFAPPSAVHNKDRAWFNGIYGVMLVEHQIGTAGMTTKFKGIKNFFPGEMVMGVAAESSVAGNVNKSVVVQDQSVGSGDTITRVPTTTGGRR